MIYGPGVPMGMTRIPSARRYPLPVAVVTPIARGWPTRSVSSWSMKRDSDRAAPSTEPGLSLTSNAAQSASAAIPTIRQNIARSLGGMWYARWAEDGDHTCGDPASDLPARIVACPPPVLSGHVRAGTHLDEEVGLKGRRHPV